jgi:uncharacterized membrane protein
VGALTIVALTWPRPPAPDASRLAAEVSLADIEAIVERRCSACHAADPRWDGVTAAPIGIGLDTIRSVRRHADAIRMQTAISRAMPQANVTGMTEVEPGMLAAWLADEPSVE